jgi:hypothetical protein
MAKNGKRKKTISTEKGKADKRASSKLSKAPARNRKRAEIQAPKKVRVNDLKTGFIKWINESELASYQKAKFKKIKSRPKKVDKYAKYTSSEQIEKLGRIRYKGRFISKKAQESILKFSAYLDKNEVDYTLADLLKEKNIENKILVVHDVTPKEMFYWNLENDIERKKFGNDVKIEIIGFNGELLYSGKSNRKAKDTLDEINRKLSNLDKVISIKEGNSAYFLVPVYETTVGTDVTALKIDLSDLRGRLPEDILNKYKSMF